MRTEVTETRTKEYQAVVDLKVSCDLCGFDEDDTMIFEVKVEIGADDCVGTRITRDVCDTCYHTKLSNLFDLLLSNLEAGEEKHQWRIEDEGDRWYG